VKGGRVNTEHSPVRPADAAQLNHAIGETRARMAASLDSIGNRLAPVEQSGSFARRALSTAYVRRHDLLEAAIATMAAVRQIAPLVRLTFPRRTLQVTLICLASVTALALAAYARTSRRP
jgi:hypothetical protein